MPSAMVLQTLFRAPGTKGFSESATESLLLSLFSSIHRKTRRTEGCALSAFSETVVVQSSEFGSAFPPVPAEANLIEVVEQMGMNSTVKS